MRYEFTDVNELEKIIQENINKLKSSHLICLTGEMGSGKTTFVQILGRLLGASRQINSPTFIIQNEYALNDGKTLQHLDLYRLESVLELKELELDVLVNESNIIVIEWADKFRSEVIKLAESRNASIIWINLEAQDESHRVIDFTTDENISH